MRYSSCVAIAALFAGASGTAAAQACGPGALALEARAVQPLPVTFGIEGALAGHADSLVLWSAEGEILTFSAPGVLVQSKLPDDMHPAGLAATPGGYRFIDRHSGREFLLDGNGGLTEVGRTPIADWERVDGAVWRSGGWTLALRDAVQLDFLVRRGADTLYRSARAATVKTIPRFHLSSAGDTLLLAEVGAPFTMLRLEPGGQVDTLAPALGGETPLIPADSLVRWRALPIVPIDCGLLVTLSDLTGDRRLLLRYALDGSLAKVTPLEAPLGLMTRVPGRESVLAARRAGSLELVWYDWRWIREPVGTN